MFSQIKYSYDIESTPSNIHFIQSCFSYLKDGKVSHVNQEVQFLSGSTSNIK